MAAVGEAALSIFIRDGTHSGATVRLVLKCDQITIQYSGSPLQIVNPGNDAILLDMGFIRPSMTISGIVDNIGGNPSNTTIAGSDPEDQNANVRGMESMYLSGQTYYIPFKNYLESFLYRISTDPNNKELEIEVGDATTPDATSGSASTGGGVYDAAVQQMQFSQSPGLEDRWMFTIGFVTRQREGIEQATS